MFEKVNPSHPDKVADRIAGALVDYAYSQDEQPKIAVEVLIGHGECYIIAETSVDIPHEIANAIVRRISGSEMDTRLKVVRQDVNLARNQSEKIRCGDNGIFCGVPTTDEQKRLSSLVKDLYKSFPYDGKYIIHNDCLTACQSHVKREIMATVVGDEWDAVTINPIGDWTGGTDVDSGATNRKLGSDMGDAVTGGGLHGKDLSKADVSVNIYAHIKAQETGEKVRLCCAIGDTHIDGIPYEEVVSIARKYISDIGGFEKFAEWGLI